MFKINRKRLKSELIGSFMVIILFAIPFFLGGLLMLKVEGAKIGDMLFMMFGFWLFAIIFLIDGIRGIKRYGTEMKRFDYLEQHGRLVKDLKYSLILFESRKNRHYKMSVDYELESGSCVSLVDKRSFLKSESKGRDTVDLIIDPNDINNYYIGFDIEEV